MDTNAAWNCTCIFCHNTQPGRHISLWNSFTAGRGGEGVSYCAESWPLGQTCHHKNMLFATSALGDLNHGRKVPQALTVKFSFRVGPQLHNIINYIWLGHMKHLQIYRISPHLCSVGEFSSWSTFLSQSSLFMGRKEKREATNKSPSPRSHFISFSWFSKYGFG